MAAVMCFENAYCFTMQSLTRAHSRKRPALPSSYDHFNFSNFLFGPLRKLRQCIGYVIGSTWELALLLAELR